MSDKAMQLELEQLRRENEMLKTKTTTVLGMKISEKGCVSVYGLGRFPVTLYSTQWESLLNRSQDIRKFIADNKTTLDSKAAVSKELKKAGV